MLIWMEVGCWNIYLFLDVETLYINAGQAISTLVHSRLPLHMLATPIWQSKGLDNWIRSIITEEMISKQKPSTILDLGFTTGMDLGKYMRAGVQSIHTLEKSGTLVEEAKKRCLDRGWNMSDMHVHRGLDTIEHGSLDAILDFDARYLSKAWSSKSSAYQWLTSLREKTKTGGYYIGVCEDSSKVFYRMMKDPSKDHYSGQLHMFQLDPRTYDKEKEWPFYGLGYTWHTADGSATSGHLIHLPSLSSLCTETKWSILSYTNHMDFFETYGHSRWASIQSSGFLSKGVLEPSQVQVVEVSAIYILKAVD